MSTGDIVVALDTNALMLPVEAKIRTFEELKQLLGDADWVVPRAVVEELDRLAGDARGSARAGATIGRRLADRHCRVIDGGETAYAGADKVLIELAAAGAVDYVVTNDADVRQAILDESIPVISLRGRDKLQVIHP